MSYQEREISQDKLQKYLRVLDSDEGIRIDNKDSQIFINKTSQRYCIEIIKNGLDQFFYQNNLDDTMRFLSDKIGRASKIFSY
jgi:hypothetical protein